MADSLPYFIEPFTGWVIRIGPDAYKRPDPYIWRVLISDDGRWLMELNGELLVPLSLDGEFQAISTQKLNSSVVRTAIKAAQSLGFDDSHWLHKEKITMSHQSLHSKHGSKMGAQMDQAKVAEITQHYLDAIKSGRMKVENVSEIDLGDGKYVRSFVIQE